MHSMMMDSHQYLPSKPRPKSNVVEQCEERIAVLVRIRAIINDSSRLMAVKQPEIDALYKSIEMEG